MNTDKKLENNTLLTNELIEKENIYGTTDTSSAYSQGVLYGKDDDDVIRGDEGNNYIYGELGNDKLYGGDGDDVLSGGFGNDFLLGERGDDTIYGGEGLDVLDGGEGDDTLYGDGGDLLLGEEGNDLIMAETGRDEIHAGDGDDEIYGGEGDDTIISGNGSDKLYGGEGNDTYVFRSDTVEEGIDRISDGDGKGRITYNLDNLSEHHWTLTTENTWQDIIGNTLTLSGTELSLTLNDGRQIAVIEEFKDGDLGIKLSSADSIDNNIHDHFTENYNDDEIHGNDDNNVIYGDVGDDRLYGGGGNDEIHGGDGDDKLNGGDGDDEIYGDGDSDYLEGNNGNDELYGGEGDDKLNGGNGDDHLSGNEGNDVLHGSLGNDELYGDLGNDELHGDLGNDKLYGDLGNDELHGDLGNDKLYGGNGDDQLYAGDGRDYLYGNEGNDVLYGGEEDDLLKGGEGDDILYGESGVDLLIGDEGKDELHGGDGNDEIHAGEGDDEIYGGEGDDRIISGNGNDKLYGGEGNDTYVFRSDTVEGTDIISDSDGKGRITYNLDNLSEHHWTLTTENTWQDVIGNTLTLSGTDLSLTLNDGKKIAVIEDFKNGDLGINLSSADSIDDDIHEHYYDPIIMGTDGNDVLGPTINIGSSIYGGYGDDKLYGKSAKDLLSGGAGNDFLAGGKGDDAYYFDMTVEDGIDRISDSDGKGYVLVQYDYLSKDDNWSEKPWTSVAEKTWQDGDGNTLKLSDNNLLLTYHDGRQFAIIENFKNGDLGFNLEGFDNHAPTIGDCMHEVKIHAETDWTYQLPKNVFIDSDENDILIYSASLADTSDLPDWLTIDSLTGALSGHIPAGRWDIKITATDQYGASVSETLVIHSALNAAPIANGHLELQEVMANNEWSYTLPEDAFIDNDIAIGDGYDYLTYSATLADGSDLPDWLTINPETGALSGVPTAEEDIDIKIIATDSQGESAVQALTLSVTLPNHAPELLNEISDVSATEGQSIDLQLGSAHFVDSDGDALNYQITQADGSALPSWLTFDEATGRLSGTPVDDQDINLTITAIDKEGLSVSDTFAIDITAESIVAKAHWLGGEVNGDSGDDTLSGSWFNDVLTGDEGNDVLSGNLGHDVLTGGLGTDKLEGGLGSDTYHFSAGDGKDIISDQGGIADKLVLTDLNIDDLLLNTQGDNWIISVKDSDDQITIEGGNQLLNRIETVEVNGESMSYHEFESVVSSHSAYSSLSEFDTQYLSSI